MATSLQNREEPPLALTEMTAAISYTLQSRRSIRGFLSDEVPDATIQDILYTAARAPSGNNIQPWQVHVVRGGVLERLSFALTNAFLSDLPPEAEYDYYPRTWREPYLARRREAGWGLYELAGVQKGDREGGRRQHALNFRFFDAPLALVFVIDKDLGRGSWLDYGMFIQSIMIAARAWGLDTCAQAAIANYPNIIREHLGIGQHQTVMCGMAIGYANPDVATNALHTSRVALEEFAVFHDCE